MLPIRMQRAEHDRRGGELQQQPPARPVAAKYSASSAAIPASTPLGQPRTRLAVFWTR